MGNAGRIWVEHQDRGHSEDFWVNIISGWCIKRAMARCTMMKSRLEKGEVASLPFYFKMISYVDTLSYPVTILRSQILQVMRRPVLCVQLHDTSVQSRARAGASLRYHSFDPLLLAAGTGTSGVKSEDLRRRRTWDELIYQKADTSITTNRQLRRAGFDGSAVIADLTCGEAGER